MGALTLVFASILLVAPSTVAQNQQTANDINSNPSQPKWEILDHADCAADIRKYCTETGKHLGSDMAALECLQDAGFQGALMPQCENLIWGFKVNITQDDRFRKAIHDFCSDEISRDAEMAKCPQEPQPGYALSCMMDFVRNISKASKCYRFMEHVERIAFTDFRLIGPFVHKCGKVVSDLNCGQLTDPRKHEQVRLAHSQGSVLECLIDKLVKNPQQHSDALKNMDETCRHEVMRLVELQSDDYHLDRELFFACRADRETFCAEKSAGEGRVFECLISHKDQPAMHPECRKVLNDRAEKMGEDFRLAPPLIKGCAQEMKHYGCIPQTDIRGSPNFHLSWVLLCLENAVHSITQGQRRPLDKPFSETCQHEMITHRQLMVDEFRMSPELVMNCAKEIHEWCSPNGDIERNGQTMHCLMGHAKERDERLQLGPTCRTALDTLIKVADLGNNYKVDKVLYESCRTLIDTTCNRDAISEAATLNCLMKSIDSADMNKDCEQRLLEVQYFMARDWTLDPQLYQACQKDAHEKCGAPDDWWMKSNPNHVVEPGPQVLACLYRNAYDEKNPLDQNCAMNVRRVLHTRAVRVNLMPEVEESCRPALSEYCSRNTDPTMEMHCLQEHFETKDFKDRHQKCYQAVVAFTKMQAKDTQLNHALTRACRPVIQTHCEHFINEDIDHGDVMECLYRHKDSEEMKNAPKCRSYVHHFELISMRDYHFSYKFTQSCQGDIDKFCKEYGQDKGSIIRCLSEVQFEHRVLGNEQDLTKDCKKQLRVAYLQQEQVNFDDKKNMNDADPKLMKDCAGEISNLNCMAKSNSFEDVVECLREGYDSLGPACKAMIFDREKVELVDNTLDDELQRICKVDIDKHCHNQNGEGDNVLDCLSNTKIVRQLRKPCLKIVKVRMSERARDVRLRPGLLQACMDDAKEHCPDDFHKINSKQYQQKLLEGVVVGCLREKFAQMRGSIHLQQQCKDEITKVIVESEFDIQLDPMLYKACKNTIPKHCGEQVMKSGGNFQTVLDCLKADFFTGAITDRDCAKQVARRTQEALVDIQLDPALHEACANDLVKYCRDVPPGQSRQITCLMDVMEVNRLKMEDNCKNKLTERRQLWKVAHDKFQVQLPESWSEVYSVIANHPQRNSLLTYIGLVILVLFVLGCCFGRCTKRTHYELKNR
ncbi:hypothetical protein QR680_000235 [Steinernema hermaphroditum]|uniref:Golgi apparatus protein 1 n=1 Tax=Steinernema hermaphroditum TaxID=289476 RepID=A0AA39LDU0_9BILA|nr:hypothetical protein QR680_000235 [Steinernema hermaphroditum]